MTRLEYDVSAQASVAGEVIRALQPRIEPLHPPMLIGAEARDILHFAQGFTFQPVGSSDIDIVVMCDGWDAYLALTNGLSPTGDTGFRFKISGVPVDIIPFGAIEVPQGYLKPPFRRDGFDVFGMRAVYAKSATVRFDSDVTCRIPTPVGYTAIKLKAWVDRSAWGHYTDALDIALCVYWRTNAPGALETVFETGVQFLERTDFDADRAIAMQLGAEIGDCLGRPDSQALAGFLADDVIEKLARNSESSSTPQMRSLGNEGRRLELLLEIRTGLTTTRTT